MCNAKKSSKYKGLDVFIICDYEHSSIKLFSVFFFLCVWLKMDSILDLVVASYLIQFLLSLAVSIF